VKSVDTRDLKSLAARHAGSIPASGTKSPFCFKLRDSMRRFKPFFIHKHYDNFFFEYRGFTARISYVDSRKVNLQITFCSPKDQFCYKKGAWYASQMPKHEINVFHLPKYLNCANLFVLHSLREDEIQPDLGTNAERDFHYVFKNFI
jgi:hypothetical protein